MLLHCVTEAVEKSLMPVDTRVVYIYVLTRNEKFITRSIKPNAVSLRVA
jgi:hypothetical protein